MAAAATETGTATAAGTGTGAATVPTAVKEKIGGVAHLLSYRDDCLAFWLIVPPLLIVPSLACSVASLSLYPEP